MPAYSFEALDAQGISRKGVMEAETIKAARTLLRTQALVPLVVEPVGIGTASDAGHARKSTTLWESRVFNASALAIWTRQIAGLVASGLPLERALAALSEEADDPRQRNLIATLRAEVNGGTSFATALMQHPREFASTYCAVVSAGEIGRAHV